MKKRLFEFLNVLHESGSTLFYPSAQPNDEGGQISLQDDFKQLQQLKQDGCLSLSSEKRENKTGHRYIVLVQVIMKNPEYWIKNRDDYEITDDLET